MILHRVAAAAGEAEKSFRRPKGYLVAALNKHHRQSRRARKTVGTQRKTARS